VRNVVDRNPTLRGIGCGLTIYEKIVSGVVDTRSGYLDRHRLEKDVIGRAADTTLNCSRRDEVSPARLVDTSVVQIPAVVDIGPDACVDTLSDTTGIDICKVEFRTNTYGSTFAFLKMKTCENGRVPLSLRTNGKVPGPDPIRIVALGTVRVVKELIG
tara:strand:+ start:5173 stop:5646 length:474 start_codon:yes stop_codon:yes gene_type:complete